jgi:hypothetical protein
MATTCASCGQPIPSKPNRFKWYTMNDDHTFDQLHVESVGEGIEAFLYRLSKDPDISLCPIMVFCNDEELRRVGKMLHGNSTIYDMKEFMLAANKDPDLIRIMVLK